MFYISKLLILVRYYSLNKSWIVFDYVSTFKVSLLSTVFPIEVLEVVRVFQCYPLRSVFGGLVTGTTLVVVINQEGYTPGTSSFFFFQWECNTLLYIFLRGVGSKELPVIVTVGSDQFSGTTGSTCWISVYYPCLHSTHSCWWLVVTVYWILTKTGPYLFPEFLWHYVLVRGSWYIRVFLTSLLPIDHRCIYVVESVCHVIVFSLNQSTSESGLSVSFQIVRLSGTLTL